MFDFITKRLKYPASGVIEDIAKEDDMYTGDKKHYFGVGQSAMKNISAAIDLANKKECLSILDMPSGYGRVLRYLKESFPEADITACELERPAVDFCVKTFGVRGVYSDKILSNIKIDNKFDLIWCGSLFTHLDKGSWPSFLKFFYDHLAEKGVLVFTTHGRFVISRMVDEVSDYGVTKEKVPMIINGYNETGFGYVNYPNNSEYGISASSLPWVFSEIAKLKGFKVILSSERGWDNHQDVFACIKESKS